MNIILQDYESLWPEVWPQHKCRSLWPMFHGPVILPYILKTIWYMNILLWDYESVWQDIWPKKKFRLLWPMFMVQWFCHTLKTFWCMDIIFWDYESVWHDIWPQNKCRSLWHILWSSDFVISWRLFDMWTPYLGIMSQYDLMFDLNINVGHCHLYFIVQ